MPYCETELSGTTSTEGLVLSINYENWIAKSPDYIEELVLDRAAVSAQRIQELCASVPLPRYVGIVRLTSSLIGTIDLLFRPLRVP